MTDLELEKITNYLNKIFNTHNFIVNKRNTFDNSSIYYNQNKLIENIQKKYTLPPPNPIIEFKREKVNIQVEIFFLPRGSLLLQYQSIV